MCADVAVAIPTYNRGAILVDTLRRVMALDPAPSAIIVVDQTREHPQEIAAQLDSWGRDGRIRWIRLDQPSIPRAMNEALRHATASIVLYLDDDLVPAPDLIAAHAAGYRDPGIWAIAGQVLQPGEEPEHHPAPADDLAFRFNHDEAAEVSNVMAGNLSVRREKALQIGGFDEHYVMVAYRFETDFALRLTHAGGRIRFEPRATIRHLKLATGGIRTFGDHRSSAHPAHSVGDYYFALTHGKPFARFALTRLRQNVLTRYHATHPWTIPTKLVGELRGLALARKLAKEGRKLIHDGLSPATQQPSNPAT